MKLFASLFLWLPSLSFAAGGSSYNIASCMLMPNSAHTGWVVGVAMGKTEDLLRGEGDRAGASYSETGGYCNLVHGTGNAAKADFMLSTFSGTDIFVLADCRMQGGQVQAHVVVNKTLGIHESAYLDFTSSGVAMREAVYLGSAEEAQVHGWFEHACQRIAAGMSVR